MISLKRQCPSLDNTIVIDEEQEPQVKKKNGKKVKTHSSLPKGSSPYDAIPEVPNINLTVEQMKGDPLELIYKLEQAYAEYGAVKLTVSEAWNCPFTFGYADRSITVRVQNLHELKQGKPFEQKVQALRVSEFKENAQNFSKTYKLKTSPLGTTSEAKLEHEYWNLVTKPKYEKERVSVEYGADLSSSQFGSGFPTRKIHNWLDADFEYETNLFNLNNIHKSPNSLLRVVENKKDKISGITLPWMYVGMQFATFCWHVEDLFLHSVNYNHLGQTKTWYVIPGKYKEAFDKHVQENYENSKKKNLLEKIILLVDPLELIQAGIPVYKVNQRPRDYVVTFLKAYHCGFSHGFNITEAVNFALYEDIDCIKESFKFYEEQELSQNRKLKSHVLSYQWTIYETICLKMLESTHPSFDKVMREYRRIINRQYIMVKEFIDQFGSFHDVKLIPFAKRYYVNYCSHCKNYLYLTSVECNRCHKNLCERHVDKCECPSKQWNLILREPNHDRLNLRALLPTLEAKMKELK